MFFIPVSLIVPGSQIPFVKGGDRDKATLDIMGQVKDAQGHGGGQCAADGEAGGGCERSRCSGRIFSTRLASRWRRAGIT